MVGRIFSRARKLEARPISRPSGMRKTKSPNPSFSIKNERTSERREGEFLSIKDAGILAAFSRFEGSELVSKRGISNLSLFICDSRIIPALGSISKWCGKLTSEITPRMYGSNCLKRLLASSKLVAYRILGRARMVSNRCSSLSPSTITA